MGGSGRLAGDDPRWHAIAARQATRLEALVWHARLASRFYADHHREVSPGLIGPEALYHLPPVTKPELMARFDDWVTEPSVTRAGVEQFVADLDNLGRERFISRLAFAGEVGRDGHDNDNSSQRSSTRTPADGLPSGSLASTKGTTLSKPAI